MTSTQDFRAELDAQLLRASRQGRPHVEVNAGELHRALGGYPPEPGKSHRMPMCCAVMREAFVSSRDIIVHEPESGKGAALTIRYMLPR